MALNLNGCHSKNNNETPFKEKWGKVIFWDTAFES